MATFINEFTPTLDGADEYFKPNNHNRAGEWDKYDPDTKTGALATAKRELESHLDRFLEVPLSGEVFDNTVNRRRDDWACYEQALDMLDRQIRTSTTSKVKKLGADQDDKMNGFRIAPIALKYARQGRQKMVRG